MKNFLKLKRTLLYSTPRELFHKWVGVRLISVADDLIIWKFEELEECLNC